MGRWGPHPAAVARTTAQARAGRSELDRLVLADPDRRVAANRAMLAAGGERCERYFRAGFALSYGAYSRCDWEVNTLFLDRDDFVFRPGERAVLPDAPSEYRGIDGYIDAHELLSASWANLRIALVDLTVADGGRVVTMTRFAGTGTRSGLPFDWECYVDNGFRDGLVISQTFWWDRREAETALGMALPTRG